MMNTLTSFPTFEDRSRRPSTATISCHALRDDRLIEFRPREQPELERGFAQGRAFFERGLGDLRRVVITNPRVQRRHQHQAMLHVILDALPVRFKAFHAMHGERPTGVGQQTHGIEEVEDHDRFEDIQLEVALRASEANGGGVAHHLYANHRERLALCGVHLARHDRGTGFVLWQRQLAQAAARAGAKPSNVIGNLHE
jgi:hypothetical protein